MVCTSQMHQSSAWPFVTVPGLLWITRLPAWSRGLPNLSPLQRILNVFRRRGSTLWLKRRCWHSCTNIFQEISSQYNLSCLVGNRNSTTSLHGCVQAKRTMSLSETSTWWLGDFCRSPGCAQRPKDRYYLELKRHHSMRSREFRRIRKSPKGYTTSWLFRTQRFFLKVALSCNHSRINKRLLSLNHMAQLWWTAF